MNSKVAYMQPYCRDEGPRKVYWAVGLVRGHLAVRGWLDLNKDVQINKL